jgi:hypothetical protein
MVYAPDGPRAGVEFDAAAALGQGPGALLFVHEITRNVAPVIRGLDDLATEYSLLGFRSYTIRLDDDRTRAESRVVTVSRAIGLSNPMVVSTEGAEGPGDYALNRKCSLTLVLTKGGTVHRSVAFTDTGDKDLAALRAMVEEFAGTLPTDEDGLRALIAERYPDAADLRQRVLELTLEVKRLREQLAAARRRDSGRMRMRRGQEAAQPSRPARPREGKAPEDEKLRELLRAVIQKDNDSARLDEVFAAIDERVGRDAGLQQQAGEMFRLMLSLGYGNEEARRRAKSWLDER